ncbi:hypothetical protein AR457_12870 [Streptomyces agglomeratus]|uniref:DUF4245 domain-containing protein n=2 Tax=Streptomyces agglomeratus TaxID=285458 RepID=A0A1E5PIR4_9ACTN|nr:hypothetical protein AS594_12700 [Streptomyces agglomeratus]OEJ40747.1 hypothetical protein BGK70_23780 [Streptomyces agglomeratus]OEJ44872.1 hypothetical protein AR457_12870 [Streptomyces agglomeratus]OEJ55897.1 hypothetical protein BGK72_23400 [Streptomyces agglomeratus]OEJ63280.1 hypothetical protein BGM19_24110 [Streptomyces agglomeratus]
MAGMRGKQTVRDMVLSMAAIGVVVAGVYTLVPHDDSADPVKPVDYRVELITARRAAPYPVAAPVGLPETWKATSVTYDRQDGNSWHLGFLDPEREYVAVEQSNGPAEKFVHKVSQQATKTSRTVRVGGETWQRWEGPKYDALVREEKGATTVITGTAPQKRLAEMAAALKAEKS